MLMVPKIKELGDITRVDIILGDGGCQETSEWTGFVGVPIRGDQSVAVDQDGHQFASLQVLHFQRLLLRSHEWLLPCPCGGGKEIWGFYRKGTRELRWINARCNPQAVGFYPTLCSVEVGLKWVVLCCSQTGENALWLPHGNLTRSVANGNRLADAKNFGHWSDGGSQNVPVASSHLIQPVITWFNRFQRYPFMDIHGPFPAGGCRCVWTFCWPQRNGGQPQAGYLACPASCNSLHFGCQRMFSDVFCI